MIPEPKTKEAAEKYIAELGNREEHHITKDFRVKLLDWDCLPCRRIWQKSKDAGVSEEYMGVFEEMRNIYILLTPNFRTKRLFNFML